MTGLVDEGRALDIVCLDFTKAFITVSYKILIEEPMKYGPYEQTVRWIESWMNGHTQRVVISGTKSSPPMNPRVSTRFSTSCNPVQCLH